jgi:hypothetical protein
MPGNWSQHEERGALALSLLLRQGCCGSSSSGVKWSSWSLVVLENDQPNQLLANSKHGDGRKSSGEHE